MNGLYYPILTPPVKENMLESRGASPEFGRRIEPVEMVVKRGLAPAAKREATARGVLPGSRLTLDVLENGPVRIEPIE